MMRLSKTILSGIAALAATALSLSTAHAESVWLTKGQVSTYKASVPLGRIVIANPNVADIQEADATEILMVGKAIGQTNIRLYDADGKNIANLAVQVRANNANTVTVHGDDEPQVYSCTDQCDLQDEEANIAN